MIRFDVFYGMTMLYYTPNLRGVGSVMYYMGRRVIRQDTKPGDHRLSIAEKLIEDAYVDDPSAFWNRPDGNYLSEEPYRPWLRVYDPRTDQTYFLELVDEDS